MINIEKLKESVLAIGYYIPNKPPQFFGTGFLIGEGDRALTCRHVIQDSEKEDSKFESLKKYKQINGKKAELCCWGFKENNNEMYMLRFPINKIATINKIHIETYYLGDIPDVAYLELDTSQSEKSIDAVKLNTLKVSKEVLRTTGSEVAMIGYPSTDLLMIDNKTGKARCMEPLAQFAKLSGVLPFKNALIPEFLAFDTAFAYGSSGSPIINMKNGKVVAIAARFHPVFVNSFFENPIDKNNLFKFRSMIPSSIGFGVSSNLFYELSKSKNGEGKFSFNESDFKNRYIERMRKWINQYLNKSPNSP